MDWSETSGFLMTTITASRSSTAVVAGLLRLTTSTPLALPWIRQVTSGLLTWVKPASTNLTATERLSPRSAATGSRNGQFNQPEGVAVDSSGNIWVADTGNYHIQEFNGSGVWLKTLGRSTSSANGQFNWPSGLALDSLGDVWVADQRNNRVEETRQ